MKAAIWTAVFLLLSFNLALWSLTLHRYLLLRNVLDERPPAYEETIDSSSASALFRLAGTPAHTIMVALLPNPNLYHRLQYLSLLHERYAEIGLAALAVVPDTAITVDSTTHLDIPFPVVQDAGLKIHRTLHVNPARGGFCVVNNLGRIEYHSRIIPDPDLMRQLAEKHALGKINYAYSAAADCLESRFRLGFRLPDLELTSLDGREHLALTQDSAARVTVVVFAAPHAACQLAASIRQLQAAVALSHSTPNLADTSRLYVLFTRAYDPNVIGSLQRAQRLPDHTYLWDNAALFQDPYATRTRNTAPLVVVTDDTGTIVESRRLTQGACQ